MSDLGKPLILLGVVLIVVGILLVFAGKIPYLGKLPGDLHFRRGNVDIYIPVVTSIVLSLLVSAVLWLVSYFSKK